MEPTESDQAEKAAPDRGRGGSTEQARGAMDEAVGRTDGERANGSKNDTAILSKCQKNHNRAKLAAKGVIT